MKLSLQEIKDRKLWEEKNYLLPQYHVEQMVRETKKRPFWIHFGAGNLFRAFHANVAQRLLNDGVLDRGLIVAEGFDYEIIRKIYAPRDNLGILATLRADGTVEKTVVASVAEALPLDSSDEAADRRLKEIFAADSLQMATFTITEKGYSLTDGSGRLLPDVAADFANGADRPVSYMGKVSALLYARYRAGRKPIAMVSTDNCSHNGDKLYAAVSAFAKAWIANGRAERSFLEYLDSDRLSFTWSMIDKITPRPDRSVEAILKEDGVEETEPVITAKNTYIAPFVNAEETEYLVIEDDFPGGRPQLERGGLIFTDRATVDRAERMKVCTCLNPLHTSLAVFGCLLGYQKISEEMKDEQLVKLAEAVGYTEGLPAVEDPGILDPKEFLDTVLRTRVTNPFLPDTPQRIATDTSQKLAIRFGETIRAYQESGTLDVRKLKAIPLVLAGWLRYLTGIDDRGEPFAPSPDPLLEELQACVREIRLGDAKTPDAVRQLLRRKDIFGVDLYEAGLADKVCGYFEELTAGRGAVRAVLKKYLG